MQKVKQKFTVADCNQHNGPFYYAQHYLVSFLMFEWNISQLFTGRDLPIGGVGGVGGVSRPFNIYETSRRLVMQPEL